MTGGRIGWILSLLLHTAVFTAAVVGLPSLSRSRPAPPPPVAVEFVRIAEKTQVAAPKAPEVAEEQTVRQQPQYARDEPADSGDPDTVPLPEVAAKAVTDIPKPAPKPKPRPEDVKRAKLRTSVRPSAKPKPPSRLKSSRIAALIDRSIKEEDEAAPSEADKTAAEEKEEKPQSLLAGLRGAIATASLRDALSNKLSKCWFFPGGAKNIETFEVTVRIWLRPDGSLSRTPEYVNARDLSNDYYRVFAESALRAVGNCAPYEEASQYIQTGQRYIDFNFNGAEFSGS